MRDGREEQLVRGDSGRWVRPVVAAVVVAATTIAVVVQPVGSAMAYQLPLLIEVVALLILGVAAARMPVGVRTVWWSLWLSLLLTVAGDIVYDFQQYVVGESPFPGWADPLYLASYVPELVAVVMLINSRHARRDAEQWLDSAIIAVPVATLVAVFVLIPMADGQGWTTTALVGIAYPVLDTVILVGLIRLLVGGGRPSAALSLITAGVTITLLADLTYNALAVQSLLEDTPGWMQGLFSLGVVLLAVGATAASASTICTPSPDSGRVMSAQRAIALGVSTLALPLLLVVGFRDDADIGVRVVAGSLFLVNLLVLCRALLLLRVVQRQRRDMSLAARTDALTGLPNRRSWDFELERTAAWSHATHTEVTIAMIDVDRFKEFNDEFGHPAGDRLLIECASAWKSVLTPDAYLARYGGDEFGLVLPGSGRAEAEPVLERLRASTPGRVSASIGYALHLPGAEISHTVAAADAALYTAKDRGRDAVAGPGEVVLHR